MSFHPLTHSFPNFALVFSSLFSSKNFITCDFSSLYASFSSRKYVGASVCPVKYEYKSGFSQFDIQIDYNIFKNFKIKLSGEHNVLNCLAAIILALKLGISESIILNAVSTFKGVKRRFSYVINSKKIILIDDYAHHPEEISKIHKSLRIIYPNEKISAIFQPHLFSRTINLIDDFANELSNTLYNQNYYFLEIKTKKNK